MTVLVTDVVRSTSLMSRLGETAFDEFRRAHFAALRKAISAHGGDEVKTTGDGLLVTFRSVIDAIRCAVAMQRAATRRAGSGSPQVAMRVGLSVGEVTLEDRDLFGIPAVEAARLAAAAEPGTILTTAMVRALARGRAEIEFADADALALKGLPQASAVCEVIWESLPEFPVPLPRLLTAMERVFVGREQELERLRQLLKEATAGDVRVALLPGESGVGKTRLAGQLARDAHEQGATVLAGRCDEDLGVPYQPFVEALRHFVDNRPGSGLLDDLGRYPGELTRLIPELAKLVPGLSVPLRSDPETERYRLFDAVAAWLAAISSDRSLVLILDDLQWAAKPTLLLLRHVARFPEARRLLIIGTYRDTELSWTHPLSAIMADLRRSPGVERLSLSGLDSSSVATLLEQAAGHGLNEPGVALAHAIYEETEGNPFFVWEVIRHLRETGAVIRRDGRWVTGLPVEEIGIPEGVRDLVGRRISRLSKTTNEALSGAAVAGVEFEFSVVEQAMAIPADDLLGALDEAEVARLLVEVPGHSIRYRFAHALVRDTLYDELSAARRASLHRRMAEAIETVHAGHIDDHLPALAHHYARAAAPAAGIDQAMDYATRAGDRALAQLAHDEAVAYYRQALDLLAVAEGVDEARRLELLISLGKAERRAGDPAYRETLLDAARMAQERHDTDALARAALANNRGFFSIASGIDAERVAVLEAALEAVGPSDTGARARLLATLAVELAFAPHPERRQQLAAEALAIARRLDDPAALGYVLPLRWAVVVPNAYVELRECVTELDAVAASLNDPALTFWAAAMGSMFDLLSGDPVGSNHRLRVLADLANELGQPLLRWVATFNQSGQRRIAGELNAAEALAWQALEIGKTAGISDAFRVAGVNLFWIRYDQGRLEDLIDQLEGAVKRKAEALTEVALALALSELDRYDEARIAFEAVAVDGFSRVPLNFAWLYGITMAAEACATLGDAERASVLYDSLTPHHDLVATLAPVGATASVAHCLGRLSATMNRHAAAYDHFAAAAEIHTRMQAPIWLARTRLEWARMLLTRRKTGDLELARELLGQALATARQLGLANVERRAAALLT